MISNDFCAFILSHGRPDNVKTLKTLKNAGYTGRVYVVIDDEDDMADEYRRLYGDMVLQFCKEEQASKMDAADMSDDRRTIVHARNACFELAREVGCRYFIGGGSSLNFRKMILRKAMNSFICDAERPFKFVGRINEDVNTYVTLGSRGLLFFTICAVSLTQTQTQKSDGGMSDVYEQGTYQKSMYTVMMHPSSVRVKEMGDKHLRLHHSINWNSTVPKIIREL